MKGGCAGERRERKRRAPIILGCETPEKQELGERWESELGKLPKTLMLLRSAKEVTSPPSDWEAALLCTAVTQPESIYSKAQDFLLSAFYGSKETV
jgi:hypothetical protein